MVEPTKLLAMGERLRAHRKRLDLTLDAMGAALSNVVWELHHKHVAISGDKVSKEERGECRPIPLYREAYRVYCGTSDEDLGFTWPEPQGLAGSGVAAAMPASTRTAARVEALRQDLDDTVSQGAPTTAALDDWEQTIARHGRATRDRAAGLLLDDLAGDLRDLQQLHARCRSVSALRRLVRMVAQMSGLVCLTFIKLDDRPAFRRWARTARIAATEADDLETLAWVLAHEAYGHYYSGDLAEAINVAQAAQAVTGEAACVGAVLAVALEARAHAALGRHRETREALGRAEAILARLDAGLLVASAFGYSEAQLRFHEGNAYTHLGDVRAAWTAQGRALELCSPGDYTDRTMIQLDRARCLMHGGDPAAGMAYMLEALAALPDEQRQGLITLRAHEVLQAVPSRHRELTPVHEVRDLLMLPAPPPTKTKAKEVNGS